jgi:hypothetical protein
MSTPAAVTEPQPGLSEGARLINTFIAPSKTFTDIRRNASWWAPWLVLSLVSLAFAFTVGKRVGYDQVVQNTFKMVPAQMEKIDKLPPEQKANAMRIQATIRKVTSYAAPVTTLLLLVIVAAILMGTFNFGAGAEATFKQSMAIVAFASLPNILKELFAIGVMFLPSFDPENFILQNPVATNPGFLIDPAGHMTTYALLSSLDVIGIWSLILIAIGFSCVTKVKRATAFAIMAGWWVFLIALGVGIAAIFS